MKPAHLLISVYGPRAKSLIREIEELAENAFEEHTMKHGQPMGMNTSANLAGIRRVVAKIRPKRAPGSSP